MCRRHSPLQQLKEAKQIALDHGCFVVEKPGERGTRYLLYRKTHPHNTYIGQRGQRRDGTMGNSLRARVINIEFAGKAPEKPAGAQGAAPAGQPAPAAAGNAPAANQNTAAGAGNFGDFDDDIPF